MLIRISFLSKSIFTGESLKSNRLVISFLVTLTALSKLCGSTLLTISKLGIMVIYKSNVKTKTETHRFRNYSSNDKSPLEKGLLTKNQTFTRKEYIMINCCRLLLPCFVRPCCYYSYAGIHF